MTRHAERPVAALPRDLAANPRLSTWLTLDPAGAVQVRVGKVELGQGILTALAQVAAEELGLRPDRVVMVPADTAAAPDQGFTAGSLSVPDTATALRHVCAQARAMLSAAAALKAGCDPAELSAEDGTLSHRGRPVATYWELAGEVSLDVDAAPGADAPAPAVPPAPAGVAPPGLPRLDLPDKVFGRPRFIHDLVLPGMVHGRVVRPPGRAARLVRLDEEPLRGLAGVLAVVRDGDFLGVVTEREDQADRAARALDRAATWQRPAALPDGRGLPDERDLPAYLRAQPAEPRVVHATGGGDQDPGGAATDAATPAAIHAATHRATYSRPFLAHASIAPSCGIARWEPDGALTVWSHTQGVYPLRGAVAQAVGLDPGRVTVRHVEGAGCYGHNAADDAAFDAVLLARAVPGRPVRLQWSRRDELGWAPFGPAMVAEVAATLDGEGRVASWDYDVWSHGHISRPGYAGGPGLLAAALTGDRTEPPAAVDPPDERGGGTSRNAVPGYGFPRQRITTHRLLAMPLRTSALRSLGAFLNVFAVESFLDELAELAGRDPVAYRLDHLTDERARAVLAEAARAAGWEGPRPGDGWGRGVAYARYKNRSAYCAVVAEVEAVHEVRVRKLVVAADVGRVISLDGVRNQLEGGAVQATSWTVKEQVRFDRSGVTSTDWEAYPILRFSEVPEVEVRVLPRQDAPPLGAGEAAAGPVAAAIGNALYDAVGVRVRDLPLTPERVVAAMES